MKLQLNERTLNAYINEAIRQELTENSMDELFGSRVRKQSRRMITGQGWGNQRADKNRNDISQTDAGEECPQTLVGMVGKLEEILVNTEKLVGINSSNQNLAGEIEQRGWLGGFKMKKSLVNAINVLTTIANRINAVERKTGLNNIMEMAYKEPIYALTRYAGNGAQQAANNIGSSVVNPIHLVDYGTPAKQATKTGLKGALKTAGTALGKAGNWAVTGVGGKTGLVGVLTSPAAIAAAAFAIAQSATVAATKGRQRNIVRTYNCAAILAKRLGNIAKQLEAAQGSQGGEAGQVNEINVRRGKRSFASIEAGMQELSNIMRQIGGVSQSTAHNRIVEIPEGLDLNTREGVLAFQQWVNSIPIADANGNPLKEDGIFGRNTNYVYDRIAQMLQQQGQSQIREGVIKESKAIETALANLERAAGATGSGGNAYSSIGAMSGGANASRLQNAQNIKNIIRTYPPVLNQYLNILSDAGADVSTLQPLNVDTRPHRNYSVKELQAIDARIKELLQIARTVEIPEGEDGEGSIIIKGTLPPKPARKPNPSPVSPKEPDENTGNTINRETTPLDVSGGNNLTGNAETDSGNGLAGERPGLTLPQSAMRTMAQTAQSTMPLRDRQSLNRRTTRNTLDALNTMRDNGAPRSQIRNDKRAVRDARRTINRGPVSEQQFKDMVKEIIKETLNK